MTSHKRRFQHLAAPILAASLLVSGCTGAPTPSVPSPAPAQSQIATTAPNQPVSAASGPENPTPDSVPACANRTRSAEENERRLAAYLARREAAANSPRPPMPPATSAVQIRDGAMPKHNCFVQVAQRGNIDLLFVGDSITDFFGRGDRGQDVWLDNYGDLNAANFGISGDTTQDVLWRMKNDELNGFGAKVIVLMLGTNNIGRNDNMDIVAGDAAIIQEFRKHQPQAKVLLLGVFPRGDVDGPAQQSVNEINAELAKLADGEHVFYLDAGAALRGADGEFIEDSMADGVHPATRGYQIWADAMAPTLKRLLE